MRSSEEGNDMENVERMRYGRSVAVEREPVMDLRRLTDQIIKLHAALDEQSERIASLESNLASHESVLGEIGAYEAVKGRDR